MDLAEPSIDAIRFPDIAYALANLCRFAGHCSKFYSVAEHSVHVARRVAALSNKREDRARALMHDAAEAYLCDLPGPVKRLPALSGYRELEERITALIAERFCLSGNPELVRRADMELLATEKAQLHAPEPRDWELSEQPLPLELPCWSPAEARSQFIEMASEVLWP